MDPLTLIAIIQGSIKTVELIRAAIRSGKTQIVKPDGTMLTEADLDAMVLEVRGLLQQGIDIAQGEIAKVAPPPTTPPLDPLDTE
jgi:hypothetical protein